MRGDDLRTVVRRSSPTPRGATTMVESHGVHCTEGRRVRCEYCGDWLRPVRRGRTEFFRHETNRDCIDGLHARGVGWGARGEAMRGWTWSGVPAHGGGDGSLQ